MKIACDVTQQRTGSFTDSHRSSEMQSGTQHSEKLQRPDRKQGNIADHDRETWQRDCVCTSELPPPRHRQAVPPPPPPAAQVSSHLVAPTLFLVCKNLPHSSTSVPAEIEIRNANYCQKTAACEEKFSGQVFCCLVTSPLRHKRKQTHQSCALTELTAAGRGHRDLFLYLEINMYPVQLMAKECFNARRVCKRKNKIKQMI